MKSQSNREIFLQKPKESLGFFPTPLQYMKRLSAELGYEIYFKRDDLTGANVYGGNKIRKLEYLLGDARARGCDTVITYGATQSNHVMETISAARKCGMTPVVYLVCIVEPDQKNKKANFLLDSLFDAEIHLVESRGESMPEATKRARTRAAQRIQELEEQGHRCYEIPTGGATGIGSAGYMDGFAELVEQMETLGKRMDYLFVSTGTGGTLAGLTAGKALLKLDTKLVGIQVSPQNTKAYKEKVEGLAKEALAWVGKETIKVKESDFECDDRFYGAGYEVPCEEANAAICYLAQKEGILTDPVYTGKGFYGMLEYLRNQWIPRGSTVVFLHTGGTTALFAEKEITGELVSL